MGYATIEDQAKQFYVLSNLIKSSVLLSYSPIAGYLLYQTMYLDEWDSNRIRIMGTLYCIPDFVQLCITLWCVSLMLFHCTMITIKLMLSVLLWSTPFGVLLLTWSIYY